MIVQNLPARPAFLQQQCERPARGQRVAAMQRDVAAIARELEWIPAGARLSQLYVGGGTPTVLPPVVPPCPV